MRYNLQGRHILVVEDQPLIAMDIILSLETAGAAVTTAHSLQHALVLVEKDGLAGAILDHALGDGDSSRLCTRLTERDIPFMIYSGFTTVAGECKSALHLEKPASEAELLQAIVELISGADTLN